MTRPLRVLVAGCGNMGASHARAYHKMPEFEIVGLVSRGPASRAALEQGTRRAAGIRRLLPGARGHADPTSSASTRIPRRTARTRAPPSRRAATSSARSPWPKPSHEAQSIVDAARAGEPEAGHRLHPARAPGVGAVHRDRPHARQAARDADEPEPAEPRPELDVAPQSDGLDEPDRRLRRPLRRRHVPDDAGQARARVGHRRAAHRRAQARHVQLRAPAGRRSTTGRWAGTKPGWGPMMSEVAFFVKDVVGPKGCVSIVKDPNEATAAGSDDIDSHTKTNCIRLHRSALDASNEFVHRDEFINTEDEPDHQALCDREQAYLLQRHPRGSRPVGPHARRGEQPADRAGRRGERPNRRSGPPVLTHSLLAPGSRARRARARGSGLQAPGQDFSPAVRAAFAGLTPCATCTTAPA